VRLEEACGLRRGPWVALMGSARHQKAPLARSCATRPQVCKRPRASVGCRRMASSLDPAVEFAQSTSAVIRAAMRTPSHKPSVRVELRQRSRARVLRPSRRARSAPFAPIASGFDAARGVGARIGLRGGVSITVVCETPGPASRARRLNRTASSPPRAPPAHARDPLPAASPPASNAHPPGARGARRHPVPVKWIPRTAPIDR